LAIFHKIKRPQLHELISTSWIFSLCMLVIVGIPYFASSGIDYEFLGWNRNAIVLSVTILFAPVIPLLIFLYVKEIRLIFSPCSSIFELSKNRHLLIGHNYLHPSCKKSGAERSRPLEIPVHEIGKVEKRNVTGLHGFSSSGYYYPSSLSIVLHMREHPSMNSLSVESIAIPFNRLSLEESNVLFSLLNS